MDIRLLVTDLDRTLLRSDKTISDHTASVLIAAKARGMRLAYATARPLRATREYSERVPCDALLCHNGGVIECGGTRISLGIPTDVRDEILAMLLRDYPDATLSMECDDRLWANFDFSAQWPGLVWTFTDFRDPTALPELPADKCPFPRWRCSAQRLRALRNLRWWRTTDPGIPLPFHARRKGPLQLKAR